MDKFLMSTEEECLTAVPDQPDLAAFATGRLLAILPQLSPSLPGIGGVFNTYGRVYPDCGHVELAAIECDSPYVLPAIVERQHTLVTQAVAQLAAEGTRLILANNNHSGLLQSGCHVWGSHENYMTDQHPARFGRWILPFLVTRIYGGAGGVLYPSGTFVAGVRPVRMEEAEGGGTTCGRAIHSTAREEHHMAGRPRRYRYHLLLGDGHRSHYNLAVQFGATALAIHAAQHDKQLRSQIEKMSDLPADDGWVEWLQQINVLTRAGRPLAIHPRVLPIQRLYLDAAHRCAARLPGGPAWIPRMLTDWEETLNALERMDRPWLAARLDAFAKYEVYSAVIREAGCGWKDLTRGHGLFHELALLDHSYHEFTSETSLFHRLERAGLLRHRLANPIPPGGESDPYVPEVETRARLRARFIRDHDKQEGYVVDWSVIYNDMSAEVFRLDHPFAESFNATAAGHSASGRMQALRGLLRRNAAGAAPELPF